MLFERFFLGLRAAGVRVSTHDWLALLDALQAGLHDHAWTGFYQVARCLLCSSESQYDAFDRVFAEAFGGVEAIGRELGRELEEWLRDPHSHPGLDPAWLAALPTMDSDALRRELLDRLRTQDERHDGGSHWIGTGGTSPFGRGGAHPSGMRIGDRGGGRSAVVVATKRRFVDYRHDRVLDTRQMGAALRRLRAMGRRGRADELDVDASIDATARQAGDLTLRFSPPRRNDVRVLLLMDVGGSMDPYADAVEKLFSAAKNTGGFRQLRSLYFHNCVYDEVHEDAAFTRAVPTQSLLDLSGSTWRLILVGDAAMHPQELAMNSTRWWEGRSGPTGWDWLSRLRTRFPKSAWLNPDPPRFWAASSLLRIRELFPMFPLSLDGLEAMVSEVR